MAVAPLVALHQSGFDIALVVSRPDAKRGRGGALVPSPVKAAAVALGLPVTDQIDDLLTLGLDPTRDLGVVVAYGRIIKAPVLDALALVNLHFSLLPRWRGAAPVERAILAGDERTGVCLMAVEEGLDTGGVYARVEVPVEPDETADELRTVLVEAGTALLVEHLRAGLGPVEAQVGDVTYAEKVAAEERRLNWTEPALALHRRVRVGDAWTTFRGRRLKVWRTLVAPSLDAAHPPLVPGEVAGTLVGTGDGLVDLVEVQPEGKARQSAQAWVNGARPAPGEVLGAPVEP
jgi:methionyl-tRNA formyltransferase